MFFRQFGLKHRLTWLTHHLGHGDGNGHDSNRFDPTICWALYHAACDPNPPVPEPNTCSNCASSYIIIGGVVVAVVIAGVIVFTGGVAAVPLYEAAAL